METKIDSTKITVTSDIEENNVMSIMTAEGWTLEKSQSTRHFLQIRKSLFFVRYAEIENGERFHVVSKGFETSKFILSQDKSQWEQKKEALKIETANKEKEGWTAVGNPYIRKSTGNKNHYSVNQLFVMKKNN